MTAFRGSMVALVTPFLENGDVDMDALARLVDLQLEGGTHGLIICGTTGEAATMSAAEQTRVLSAVVKRVNGRVPVIAGTGSNNTLTAIASSKAAKDAGADGLLVVTPYYNKPTQDGLVDYFNAITEAVQHPVVLYNVPGRTGCNMQPSTVERLADNPHVVAIKDATGDMNVASELKERCGDRITLLSGDDFTALPFLSVGGQGWISVTANVLPKKMADLFNAWEAGDAAKARELHYELLPIHRSMFTQSNPIPCKAALGLMELCGPTLRAPLKAMTGVQLDGLKATLKAFGALGGANS